MFRTLSARLAAGNLVSADAVRLVAAGAAAGHLGVIGLVLAQAPGMVDAAGVPVGHDFSLFYAAGRLAMTAGVEAIYDLARLGEAARGLFGAQAFVAVWPYPPPMAALMAQLAGLAYPLALGIWLILPLAALAAWLWWATRSGLAVLLVAGAPAAIINAQIGQAAPIFALILGAGVLAAARGAAGGAGLLGLMIAKPHLAVLAPVALAAGRRWPAFLAAGAVAVLLVGLSVAMQGSQVWLSWIGVLGEASRLTETAAVDSRLPSVLAAARMLGLAPGLGLALQAGMAIAVLGTVAVAWRRGGAPEALAGLVLIGAPLVPPYVWHYDGLIVQVGVALLVVNGLSRGFAPWEKLAFALVWLAPLVNIAAGGAVPVPILTLAGLAAFAAAAGAVFGRPSGSAAGVRQHTEAAG